MLLGTRFNVQYSVAMIFVMSTILPLSMSNPVSMCCIHKNVEPRLTKLFETSATEIIRLAR